MRILITGSGGMVGRGLLSHQSSSDFELLTPSRAELDLNQFDEVVKFLKLKRPDLIIHAAGRVGGIKANIADPTAFFLENLLTGINLIIAARDTEIPHVLNLGSTCMYPRNAKNPLLEDDILTGKLEPTNEGYALAKICVSKLGGFITADECNTDVKTIIPCNLYGPFDKFDELNGHLIPSVLRKLHYAKINNEQSVKIWGDGAARREFMFVNDLADLVWKACKNIETLPSIMNAGTGRDFTITEYYETVASVVNYTGSFEYDLSQPTGMEQKLANTTKASNWGWEAKTSLTDGLSITYDYFKREFS